MLRNKGVKDILTLCIHGLLCDNFPQIKGKIMNKIAFSEYELYMYNWMKILVNFVK